MKVNNRYKQKYHANVPSGWSNDPNGMIYYNGKVHLDAAPATRSRKMANWFSCTQQRSLTDRDNVLQFRMTAA